MRKTASKSGLNQDKIKTSTDILRALAHPLRLRILQYIDAHKSVHVNNIYNSLEIEQSITSQHLRILRSNGLVQTVRDGKYINYGLDYEKIFETQRAVGEFINFDIELTEDDFK
jgi:DNA-binding transcriptional ArsR family regulator